MNATLYPRPTNEKPLSAVSTQGPEQTHMNHIIVPTLHSLRKLCRSPRQVRAVYALLQGDWVSREAMDRLTGASNGPEIVAQLRRLLGQDAIATRTVEVADMDGRPSHPGQYRLTPAGRQRLAELEGATC